MPKFNIFRLVLIGFLLILIFITDVSAQTKCSNTPPIPYLCDPGFENSSVRNGNIVHPKQSRP